MLQLPQLAAMVKLLAPMVKIWLAFADTEHAWQPKTVINNAKGAACRQVQTPTETRSYLSPIKLRKRDPKETRRPGRVFRDFAVEKYQTIEFIVNVKGRATVSGINRKKPAADRLL